jgi:putative addiction module killer protein
MPSVDKPLSVLYEGQKYRLVQTTDFAAWFQSLRDRKASAKINDRLLRAADGNFGDVKDAGKGLSELRIDYGPGYRVYFSQRGNEIVLLLYGGDKRTQKRDITRALWLRAEVDRRGGTSSF